MTNHREVLRLNFQRVADITNDAYLTYERDGSRLSVNIYKEWAMLLIRYHDAMERSASKGEEVATPPSMKGDA